MWHTQQWLINPRVKIQQTFGKRPAAKTRGWELHIHFSKCHKITAVQISNMATPLTNQYFISYLYKKKIIWNGTASTSCKLHVNHANQDTTCEAWFFLLKNRKNWSLVLHWFCKHISHQLWVNGNIIKIWYKIQLI